MLQRLGLALLLLTIPAPAAANDGCTATTTPGCGGCVCESCVCGQDDYCCSTAWDDLCVDACQNICGGCGGGGGGACGNVSFQGCCQGQVVMFCLDDSLQQIDCSEAPSCGWNAAEGYYDCQTTGTPDPSGMCPMACGGGTSPICGNGICEAGENTGTCPQDCGGACTPACGDKECGDDGCGGSCGVCPEPGFCNYLGQCEGSCVKECQGKDCGPDGCGGQCGACGIGETCDEATGLCGQGPEECVPDCIGKQCGPDGCGDVCGECPYELACAENGLCVDPDCAPDCAGVVCGDDGCGGSCGLCPDGTWCNGSGLCEAGESPREEADAGTPYGNECPPGQSLLYGKCIAVGNESTNDSGGGCGAGPGSAPLWALLLLLPALRRRIRVTD